MALSKDQMVTLYTNLVRADRFDKMMYQRMLQGKLIGFFHPGEGAIAPGVAAASFLKDDDNLSPHHRGHAIPLPSRRPKTRRSPRASSRAAAQCRRAGRP